MSRRNAFMHIHIHTYTHTYMLTYVRTCTDSNVHTFIRIYVNEYIRTCVCNCIRYTSYVCVRAAVVCRLLVRPHVITSCAVYLLGRKKKPKVVVCPVWGILDSDLFDIFYLTSISNQKTSLHRFL
jgi:hypothetical protein